MEGQDLGLKQIVDTESSDDGIYLILEKRP